MSQESRLTEAEFAEILAIGKIGAACLILESAIPLISSDIDRRLELMHSMRKIREISGDFQRNVDHVLSKN